MDCAIGAIRFDALLMDNPSRTSLGANHAINVQSKYIDPVVRTSAKTKAMRIGRRLVP